MRLKAYINSQQADSAIIKKLKDKGWFPGNTIIGFGDFNNMGSRHHSFLAPVIQGKHLRAILRKAGYPVYLVDEYNTSAMCSNCEHADGKTCKTKKKRNHPNTKKSKDERERLARPVQYEMDLIIILLFF